MALEQAHGKVRVRRCESLGSARPALLYPDAVFFSEVLSPTPPDVVLPVVLRTAQLGQLCLSSRLS